MVCEQISIGKLKDTLYKRSPLSFMDFVYMTPENTPLWRHNITNTAYEKFVLDKTALD